MVNTNMPHIIVVSFPRYFRVNGLVVRSPRPPVCQETSGGFHKWGNPNSSMVCNGKPEKNMDDEWGISILGNHQILILFPLRPITSPFDLYRL